MAAGKLNITIEQGADFSRQLTIQDGTPAAIDLTGYTFQGQVRRSVRDALILGTFSFTLLNQTTNKGKVTWAMSSADTEAIPLAPGASDTRTSTYYYDVEMTSPGGAIDRILEGAVTFSGEVTR